MKAGFLFEVWPYAALPLFVAGIAFRYALANKNTIAAELSKARDLFDGGGWWRWSLVLLLLGHLAGLLFPRELLLWNTVPTRLYVLEAFAFAAGLAALAGWAILMWRQLGHSTGSAAAQVADVIFLSLLFAAFASGLSMAVFYRWASTWGALTLTPYARSILWGRPAAALAAQMPFVVQLHVFSAFASMAMLPFTRVAPLLVHAIRSALDFGFRPISALAEWSRTALEAWTKKHNPTAWIWPEED